MIPYFDGRVGPGLEVLGSRTTDEDYSTVLSSLKRPHMDYFRMFYADTAMFGCNEQRCNAGWISSGRTMSYSRRTRHVVRSGNPWMRSITTDLSQKRGRRIFSGNTRKLLRLPA